MRKLLLAFSLLCRGDLLNAHASPALLLGLDVNGKGESTAARGWTLLIRIVLVSNDGQPVKVALQNGGWTQALRLSIVDQNQAAQNWPVQLLPPASPTLNLDDQNSGEAVWTVAPADSAGLLA